MGLLKRLSIRTPYHILERNVIESWKPGESLSFGGWRWIRAAQSRPPSISAASDYRAGVRQECDADGHTRLRKRAFLTRPRLAAGHADKDAHDADEWRKWRRDRILAASETVGVG